ncbi:hypothetical protein [Desulfatibacillum aliphaticivorans]|uniref:hypothetical protein n=1 Tax=Desulfatibacillum aliphaticivorans TaxID=218208 RepID=UPI0005C21DD8|nr:hypothetical protein [Desulfatibacillum aliphaticivorans]
MREFLEFVDAASSRLGMYCPGKTYGEFVAMIYGFSFARNHAPLLGFREWLVMRFDGGNNMTWDGLALFIMNIRLDSYVEGDDQNHLKAVRGAANLISEFVHEREECGLRRVMVNYQNWLMAQSWYDPEIYDSGSYSRGE